MDSPIQEGDVWILQNAMFDMLWYAVLSMMPLHERIYWRLRGHNAYMKNHPRTDE